MKIETAIQEEKKEVKWKNIERQTATSSKKNGNVLKKIRFDINAPLTFAAQTHCNYRTDGVVIETWLNTTVWGDRKLIRAILRAVSNEWWYITIILAHCWDFETFIHLRRHNIKYDILPPTNFKKYTSFHLTSDSSLIIAWSSEPATRKTARTSDVCVYTPFGSTLFWWHVLPVTHLWHDLCYVIKLVCNGRQMIFTVSAIPYSPREQ